MGFGKGSISGTLLKVQGRPGSAFEERPEAFYDGFCREVVGVEGEVVVEGEA